MVSPSPDPIPLQGPLFEGREVRVGWPEPDEYDRITALRNRPAVRQRFLDPRPLDIERNREWLARGMRRPYEALLSIRLKRTGGFVGAIGWSAYDPATASFEMGRVMVDTGAVLPYRDRFPPGYEGIAADAGVGLRDFGFERMGLALMRSEVIGDNALSRRATLLGGARPAGRSRGVRADGTEVDLIHFEMTREEWLAIRSRSKPPERLR